MDPLQLAESIDSVLTSSDALLGQLISDETVAQAGLLVM